MSDFKKFLQEQLENPDFRKFWEARNELLLQQTAGTMALSEMDLTEEDKIRILRLLEHPDELDAMLEELIRKHTVMPEHEVLRLNNEPVTIWHKEKGTWDDVADAVYSIMDMNDVILKSGEILNMDDYGKIWRAYRREI